jgi:TonB-linked SusC/RagA family outer membrane protein
MKKPKFVFTDKGRPCLKKTLLIMKLIVALLAVNLLSLQAVTFSQSKKLSLNLENVSIKEVFSTIEAQSNYRFLYNEKSIENQIVSINSQSGSIDHILAEVLSNTGSSYRMLENNLIVITPDNLVLKQGIAVKGKVTDAAGDPLPGVNVVEKGTNNGTITDADGDFSITVTGQQSILVFSSVGYLEEEVQVGGTTNIELSMAEDIQQLDEVVVVGYGTVKKSDLTGSVVSVGQRELEQGTVVNPLEAMQGRAAGVDISSNARPGEIGTMRIRGERSISDPNSPPTAANDPLFVVDGIPMAVTTRRLNTEPDYVGGSVSYEDLTHNPVSDLNPNDIESIEILKDASATAIYGSRAANGVVLITTKRGKAGKTRITYDASVTFETFDDRLKMFNAADQMEANREVMRSSGAYPSLYPNPRFDYMIMSAKDYDSWLSIAMGYEWEDFGARIPVMRPTTPEEQELWGVAEVPVYDPAKVRNTDWLSYAIQTGITQNHQIGASMGTDKMRSYISFGYLDQDGVEKGQSYTRYSALVSLDLDLNKRMRIGGSMNGMVADQEFGINTVDLARGLLPFTVPYDTAGNFIWLPGNDPFMVNFIKDIDNERNNRKSYHIRGSFYGEVDLFKGLKYRVNFGPDFRLYRNGTFQSAQTTARWGSSSYARYFQDQTFNWTLENLLYYDATINDVHNLGITLLQSAEQYTYEYSHVSAQDLPYDEQLWYDLRSSREGQALDFGSNYEAQTRQSYMARINYGLMNKYLLTLSGRWDGASVLAPGNKWQFFPSVAVAWKLHEESFMKNLSAITVSKIRVGWGITGNSLIPPYQASGSITNLNYAFGDQVAIGYKIETPPNAELNWERTSQLNIGYDFGFLRNRISGSIDIYNANTYDLLMDRTIPVVNGANHVYFNIGQTRNRGIEIMLSTINVSTKDFSWRTDITFSRNINEIIELYNGKNDDLANRWFIGEPINVNYGYVYDGIWGITPEDSALFRQYYGTGVYNRAGQIRIKDLDTTGGQYVFNSFDQEIRGSAYPDFISGITNYITYKGFELSFFLYARVGQTINKATPLLFGRYHDVAVDYWTPLNTDAMYPRPKSGLQDTYMSSLGYQLGSFLKVRNISLKYNLPKSILSKINMSDLAIRLQFLNPFLFTKAVNVDPDVFTTNPNLSSNGTKGFVIGINVGF